MPETWTKAQIEEKVKQLIDEQLHVAIADLREDGHLVDDYGADSLDLTELIISLEDEFNIRVPESEMKNLTTLGSIIQYLAQHLQVQN